MSDKAKDGLKVEGRVPSEWNRFTVADGNWLNEKDIKPFSARDEWLAECIDDLEDSVTELGERKTSNIYLNGESAERLDFSADEDIRNYSEKIGDFKALLIPSAGFDGWDPAEKHIPTWDKDGTFNWMDKEDLASESYYKRAMERGSELPNDDGYSVVFGADATASENSIAANGASAKNGSIALIESSADAWSIAFYRSSANYNSFAHLNSTAETVSFAKDGSSAVNRSMAFVDSTAKDASFAFNGASAINCSTAIGQNSVADGGALAVGSISYEEEIKTSAAYGSISFGSKSLSYAGSYALNGASATIGSIAINAGSSADFGSFAWGNGAGGASACAQYASYSLYGSAFNCSFALKGCNAFTIGVDSDSLIIPQQESYAENHSLAMYGSSAVNHSIAFRGSSAIENSIAIKGSIANDNSIAYKGSSAQSGSIAITRSTAFDGSLAFNRSVAKYGSVALADKTTAENHSFAFGQLNSVADYSYGIGYNNEISGGGYALGKGLKKYYGNGRDQTIVGTYNDPSVTASNTFVVGDGTTDTNRHNAMLVGRVKNNDDQNSFVSAYDFLLSNRNGGYIDLYDALQAGGGGGISEIKHDATLSGTGITDNNKLGVNTNLSSYNVTALSARGAYSATSAMYANTANYDTKMLTQRKTFISERNTPSKHWEINPYSQSVNQIAIATTGGSFGTIYYILSGRPSGEFNNFIFRGNDEDTKVTYYEIDPYLLPMGEIITIKGRIDGSTTSAVLHNIDSKNFYFYYGARCTTATAVQGSKISWNINTTAPTSVDDPGRSFGIKLLRGNNLESGFPTIYVV